MIAVYGFRHHQIGCLFRPQCRFYYKANDGVLPRRDSRRTLARTRRELVGPPSTNLRRILLPPYVAPGELRILLGIEYKSALALCQVKLYQQKYFWRDLEGRTFETANKRKVLVPFSLVVHPIKLFGMEPLLVDPEPQIADVAQPDSPSLPVVALVGVTRQPVPYGALRELNGRKATILSLDAKSPRPMLGRTVSQSDIVVTTDELMPEIEVIVARMSHKPTLVLSPIVQSIDELQIGGIPPTQARAPVACPAAVEHRAEIKRTDVLVDAHKAPSSWSVILDVEKNLQQGTTALILVKSGTVRVGSYFVAGSGFGKVVNIYCAESGASLKFATPGMVVRVGRLIRNEEYTGDFAPDDNLFIFSSRERAWRLAFHRQRIEWLNSFQTDGPRLDSHAFELDSNLDNPKTQNIEGLRTSDSSAEKAVRYGSSFPDKDTKERYSEYLEQESILVPPYEARAAAESLKVETRWKQRQDARIAAKREAFEREATEKKHMHQLRQLIHKGSIDKEVEGSRRPTMVKASEQTSSGPLPVSQPVVPVIVKTKSVSQFDAVLDELEALEKEFGVKIPVVHGGIGPVSPTDVVHAEVESKFGPCCIYTLEVETLPECRTNTGVDVIPTENMEDLIGHVRGRIMSLKKRSGRNAYLRKLRRIIDDS